MNYTENAKMATDFLYLNKTDFARQYIFPTVAVFANRDDQRWLTGFWFQKSDQIGGDKEDGTHMEEERQKGHLLVC